MDSESIFFKSPIQYTLIQIIIFTTTIIFGYKDILTKMSL